MSQDILSDTENHSIIDGFMLDTEDLSNKIVELLNLTRRRLQPREIEQIYRYFHNIKGAASFLSFEPIVKVCHESEQILKDFLNNQSENTRFDLIEKITSKLDELGEKLINIKSLQTGKDHKSVSNFSIIDDLAKEKNYDNNSIGNESNENFVIFNDNKSDDKKTPDEKLDTSESLTTETVDNSQITKLEQESNIEPPAFNESPLLSANLTRQSELKNEDPLTINANSTSGEYINAEPLWLNEEVRTTVPISKLDNLFNEINLMNSKANKIHNIMETSYPELLHLSLSDSLNEVQNYILKLRMSNIAGMLKRVIVMSKAFANQHNLDINFELKAENIVVDCMIIEQLQNPLIHLVRNSIDHGFLSNSIDWQGKNNKIIIKANQNREHLFLSIFDNGIGLNLPEIKKIAKEKNLLDGKDYSNLDSSNITKLIFAPGFSTREATTNISGRGMGLSSVKETIARLHGKIDVVNCDEGCKFTIRIPNIYTMMSAVGIEINSYLYYISAKKVEHIIDFNENAVQNVNDTTYLRYKQQVIPICDISYWLHKAPEKLLGDVRAGISKKTAFADKNYTSAKKIIILRSDTSSTIDSKIYSNAIIVDKIPIEQEILVKPLQNQHSGVLGFVGNLDSDKGDLSLVLDVDYFPQLL